MLAKFFGQTAIYGLGALASSGVSFFLLPVYTRHLSPVQYGQLEALNALGQILLVFFGAGIASSFFAVHFRLCEDGAQQQTLVKTALYALLALASGQAVLMAAAAPFLSTWLHLPVAWLWMVIAAQWAAAIGLLPFSLCRSRQKAGWFVVMTLCQLAALLGLNIWHVAWAQLGVPGVLLSQMIVYGVTAGLTIGTLLWRWGPHTDFRYLRRLLVWGYTNVPNSLAGWTTNLADRYFLLASFGASQVGVYAVGYKLGMILHVLLVMPLAIAWAPFLQGVAHRAETPRLVATVFGWVTLLAACLWVTLGVLADPLVDLMGGPGYEEAAQVTPIVLFGYVLAALTPLLASGINLAQRYHWFVGIGLAIACTNLAFNAWWIPLGGPLGAAWATVATFAAGALGTWAISQRLTPIPFPMAAACGWFLLAGAWVLAGSRPMTLMMRGAFVLSFWLLAACAAWRMRQAAPRPLDDEIGQRIASS